MIDFSNKFVISDLHLGHEKSLTFIRADGNKLRPFDSLEDMHQHMIDCWNSIVMPSDKVYVLGDIAIKKSGLDIVKYLNGHKRLVAGNHDVFLTKEYLAAGFEELYGVKVFPEIQVCMTHVPVHPDSIKKGWVNYHGHTHDGHVMLDGKRDYRYINLSCEQINFTPISIEDVRTKIKNGTIW